MGRLLARNFSGPSIFCNVTTIAAPTSPLLTSGAILDTVSYSVWVHVSSSPGYSIFDVTSGNSFGLRYTGTKQFALWYNGAQILASAVSHWRKWVHVAATYDRVTGACAIYLNGALSSSTVSSVAQATPTNLKIANGVYSSLVGYIAEPAIFNRALTAEEIRAIYEQGPVAYPKDGSCVLDYRFKEGAINGATIIDSSGKGNHGTLTLGSGRIDPYNIPVPNRVVIPGNMPIVAVESTGTTAISVSDSALKTAFGETGAYVGSVAAGITVGGWVKRKKAGSSSNRLFAKGSYGSGVGVYTDILQTGGISSNATGAVSVVAASQIRNPSAVSAYQHISVSSKTGAANTGAARFHTNGNVSQANPGVTITSAANGDALNILGGTGAGVFSIALPFLANRVLTDEEIYNIYSKAIFPADVLFWHGADSTGTKIMCHKGSYGNRPAEVVACDAFLGSGNYFTDDVPWR